MNKPFIATILCAFTLFQTTIAQKARTPVASGQLLEQASNLYDSAQYKKAVEIYRQIDRNDTNFVRACYGMAAAYAGDSQYTASIEAVKLGLANIAADPEREHE